MRIARLDVALIVSAALVLPLAAAADDDLRLVLAKDDGSYAAAQLPLSDAQLVHAKSVWAWTTQLPPRKVDLRQIGQQREAIVAELRRLPARPLEVRLRGWSRPEQLASLRVIAAPVEMWASVPEPLLPSFAVAKDGRVTINVRDPVRIRVVGEGFGTMWEPVTRTMRSIDIQLRRPAADASPTFRLSDGSPAARLFAMVMTRGKSGPRLTIQAQFTSGEKGSLRIPSLPESEVISLFVRTDQSAPQVISGTAAELSRVIALAASARIRGKFVDDKNRPLAGVNVEAEGWVSPDAPAATRGDAVSDEAGQWAVQGLPRADVIVRASAAQRSAYRKRLSLQEGDVDLGTLPLPKSTPVVLTVSDAARRPLSDVSVESDSGFKGRTNRDGAVTLTGLFAAEENSVTVTASGFVKQTIHLAPPLPKSRQVVMEGAFSVRGRVVTDNGEPLTDATAVVTVGPRYRNEAVNADGTFAFEVAADEDFGLTFESPAAASVTRQEPKGRAGEIRDVGTIRLPSGRSVHGRITDSASAPVNGARIWALRPTAGGAVNAWAAGRIVQASSDADGVFDLRGLTPGPALLRIDAPDFARAFRDVLVEDNPVDLGVIELARGYTVAVKTGRADAAVARLDLRSNSLDADMLTAPVVTGEAHLRHVPSGRYKVSVMNGNAVVCEQHVEVNDADVSVECAGPMTVSGRVLLGGAPASGGTLTWVQPSPTDGLIQTTFSPLGAMQQRVYGLGGGIVSVPVQPDGTFETNQLRPGDWRVGWRSSDSTGTPDRAFTIPDAPEAQIVVEFSGGVIHGRVLDESNGAAPGARVREIQGPLYGMAAADGSFTMTAVQPGVHRLQASLAGKTSSVAQVRVEEGKQAPDVVLRIGDAAQNLLSVRVTGIDGEPKPNAFVFVELTGGILKTITADANGVATASVAEGLPEITRLVAFAGGSWAFGEFRHGADDAGPYQADIRFTKTGSLRVRSATVSGTPVLLAPRVPGDFAWMLARIGTFVSVAPQSPLVISGLPAGTYAVRVGSQQMAASVTAGSTATIDLP
jgi:hypothetical protein